MNAVLWILQVFLALVFCAHGYILLVPPASLVEQMKVLPDSFRIFLGAAEVVAAVGLILPAVTRVQPWLVWTAAAGIMIVMISATIFHLVRGEYSSALTTVILLVMATFVAYQRWKVRPILPKAVTA